MARTEKYLKRLKDQRTARAVVKKLEGWAVVAKYEGSNGKSIHTVERNGDQYHCTCQAFRIQGGVSCKHTFRAQEEGL